MSENLNIANYIKSGTKINFVQVLVSFVIGLVGTIVFYYKLNNYDFIFYTTAQLTIFFFVSFSMLELGNYLKKFIPVESNIDGISLLSRLVKISTIFFSFSFSVFVFISFKTKIYQEISVELPFFLFYIFISSFIQIFVNFQHEYLTAKKKFYNLEKLFLFYLNPIRFVFILIFYINFDSLIYAFTFNIIFRLNQLFVVNLIFEDKKIFYYKYLLKFEKYRDINLFESLKFSIKNSIFSNYPLILLAISPLILGYYYSPNDVAVFSLSVTLFNSIKPIFFGLSKLINPLIVRFIHDKNFELLKIVIRLFNKIFISIHLWLIVSVWLFLNEKHLTDYFLQYFSYSLFQDFAISMMAISLFYIFNLVMQSVYLGNNKERQFFYSSCIGLIMSALYIYIFFLNQVRINFFLISLVVFYCAKYLYLVFDSKLFDFKDLFDTFLISVVLISSLRTLEFSNIPLFILLLFGVTLISFKRIQKLLNNNQLN